MPTITSVHNAWQDFPDSHFDMIVVDGEYGIYASLLFMEELVVGGLVTDPNDLVGIEVEHEHTVTVENEYGYEETSVEDTITFNVMDHTVSLWGLAGYEEGLPDPDYYGTSWKVTPGVWPYPPTVWSLFEDTDAHDDYVPPNPADDEYDDIYDAIEDFLVAWHVETYCDHAN